MAVTLKLDLKKLVGQQRSPEREKGKKCFEKRAKVKRPKEHDTFSDLNITQYGERVE